MVVIQAFPLEHYVSATDLLRAEGKMADVVADYLLWKKAMFRAFRRPKSTKRVLTPTRGYWRPK